MAIIEVNQDTFEQEVLKSEMPVVVDFNATWCGPCKMMKPILEELSAEKGNVKFVAIDVDENDELAEDYEISSIPCLVLFKNGEEANRKVGLAPKAQIAAFAEG